MVEPAARDLARRRIAAVAVRYAREGGEIEDRPGEYSDETAAIKSLVAAMRDGDGDGTDAAALFLIPRVSALAFRRALASEIIPMLGAAAHAPILLAELPRLEAQISRGANAMLRGPLRDLTRSPHIRLSWHDRAAVLHPVRDDGEALFETLLAPPHVHSDSVYIAPTILAVEANGYAERLLADVTCGLSIGAAQRMILRIGALSMLQDDPESAPYGWSHAITMPQGVLACVDEADDCAMAVRVAATHALGFRATMGKARLVYLAPPKPRSSAFHHVAPIEAAGAVYHAESDKIGAIMPALATRAATQEDAHLAKYTLACFDAASRDSSGARLFLAAAAYLGAWWDAHPGASFE
jgi:hypothetical protein